MAKLRDKPPPQGYERHPRDPNLIRKIAAPPPLTVAQAMYPNLRSEYRAPLSPKPINQGRKER
jgi:hypothetical protein